jgi:hypothetical protein
MTAKRTKLIILVCLSLALAQQLLYSQTRQAKPSEPAPGQPKKQRDGFVDYTLKRINPTDKNYGECIDDGRRLLLNDTIENSYFWSNVLTLGLLLAFFLVILFQWGLLNRRALIYAGALRQYQSALARAEAHGEEATRRNHTFMEALRLAIDPAARKPHQESVAPISAASGSSPSPAAVATKQRKDKDSSAASIPSGPGKPEPNGSMSLPVDGLSRTNIPSPVAPGLDLIAQNNALQQQLGLTQDQVKQLRRQLNEGERQLQAEKQKNRTLKGE